MNLPLRIQAKLARRQKLTAPELQIYENYLAAFVHKRREKFVDTADGFHIQKTMSLDPMIAGINMLSQHQNDNKKARDPRRYIGSIDPLTAVNWAKECGHPVYSAGWREFCINRIKNDPDYSVFKSDVAPTKRLIV